MDYRVTIPQTGKHQTTLFVLSMSTDPSLHCLLVCLVVKYQVHNESQNLGPSMSRCGKYTALCCNCDSTHTSILSVSVLTTSLEISPPPPSAHSLSPHFLPCLPSLSLFLPLLSPILLLSLFPLFLFLSLSLSYGPLPLKEHLQLNKCILVHKPIHNKSLQYLRQLVHTGARNDHSSRNSILILPKTRIDIYKMSFAYSGSICWNALPRSLKTACSVSTFKSKALQHFRTECNIGFQS